MEITKCETNGHVIDKHSGSKQPIILPGTNRNTEALGFQRALKALSTAYAQVAAMLDDALDRADTGLSQLAALGASYAWVSERRSLVKTYLESDPAILAYANCDCPRPDEIRSLAETATELASDRDTLSSALGLLNYIERELGWAEHDRRLAAN